MGNSISSDYYNQVCLEGFEKNDSPQRRKRLIEFIELDSTSIVGDFGCGSGMMMEHVAPLVTEYIGVDFAPPFIEEANQTGNSPNPISLLP